MSSSGIRRAHDIKAGERYAHQCRGSGSGKVNWHVTSAFHDHDEETHARGGNYRVLTRSEILSLRRGHHVIDLQLEAVGYVTSPGGLVEIVFETETVGIPAAEARLLALLPFDGTTTCEHCGHWVGEHQIARLVGMIVAGCSACGRTWRIDPLHAPKPSSKPLCHDERGRCTKDTDGDGNCVTCAPRRRKGRT